MNRKAGRLSSDLVPNFIHKSNGEDGKRGGQGTTSDRNDGCGDSGGDSTGDDSNDGGDAVGGDDDDGDIGDNGDDSNDSGGDDNGAGCIS